MCWEKKINIITFYTITYAYYLYAWYYIWADRILKYNNKYMWMTCLSLVSHTDTYHIHLGYAGWVYSHSHNVLYYLTRSCINLWFALFLTTQRPSAFATTRTTVFSSIYLYVYMYVFIHYVYRYSERGRFDIYIQGGSSSTFASSHSIDNWNLYLGILYLPM